MTKGHRHLLETASNSVQNNFCIKISKNNDKLLNRLQNGFINGIVNRVNEFIDCLVSTTCKVYFNFKIKKVDSITKNFNITLITQLKFTLPQR